MKILVVGNGGREHALVWKIAQSPKVKKIYCAPGNPGTGLFAENVPFDTDIVSLAEWAENQKIDLTVIGPETYLSMGIVDEFNKRGLPVFGPDKKAAEIESSKLFAKRLMEKYRIPTAGYKSFSSFDEAMSYIQTCDPPFVIKANGLAAGKGVIVAQTMDDAQKALELMLKEKKFGAAGEQVIIEEYLSGEEASILAFSDGRTVKAMVSAQDHKRVFDGDLGPNTGGMGAYSPAPVVTEKIYQEVLHTILIPAVEGMAKEGRPFTGVLYAGLMITPNGPKVVEFNARFGDPETQVILPRLKNDLVDVLLASVNQKLHQIELAWHDEPSVCVVLTAGGYPGVFNKGDEINGIEPVEKNGCIVFQAGTARKNNKLVTCGGRVLNIVALAGDIPAAIEKVYENIKLISFKDMHYRKDIAHRALKII